MARLLCATFLTILILIVFKTGRSCAAVLLWETKEAEVNTTFAGLHKVTGDDFQKYIEQKYTATDPSPMIVVFVEDSLTVEDLSWKNANGIGNFPNLNNLTESVANVEFMPQLDNVLGGIRYLKALGHDIYEIGDKLEKEYSCGDVVIVNLPTDPKHRPNMLRQHDQRICDMFTELCRWCEHTIGVLLGLKCPPEGVRPSSRVRKVLTRAPGYLIFQDPRGVGLLITRYFINLTRSGESVLLGEGDAVVRGRFDNSSHITMTVDFGDHNLTVHFDNLTAGYWYLRTIDVASPDSAPATLRPLEDVYAPISNSFHIPYTLVFKDYQGTELAFGNLQVQPFFLNPGSKAFGEAVDAVPFFTAAILSGLLVVALMGLIFSCGLCMLMDIRTMTRFEDPNSKGLVILATDRD